MVKESDLVYKGYCWCFGTTSFRTKNFNRKIEEQLKLLRDFFVLPQNVNQKWGHNTQLQRQYYSYMQDKEFVTGSAQREDKDAREKTSGLVDLGLIDSDRHLTEVGNKLLEISLSNDFLSDNFLQIPKDSFIYLKQLLKTSILVDKDTVRPLIVLLYLLSELDYLTKEEFTFLLPLCTNNTNTTHIKEQIKISRQNNKEIDIDSIITTTLLEKENYQKALSYLLENKKSFKRAYLCNRSKSQEQRFRCSIF